MYAPFKWRLFWDKKNANSQHFHSFFLLYYFYCINFCYLDYLIKGNEHWDPWHIIGFVFFKNYPTYTSPSNMVVKRQKEAPLPLLDLSPWVLLAWPWRLGLERVGHRPPSSCPGETRSLTLVEGVRLSQEVGHSGTESCSSCRCFSKITAHLHPCTSKFQPTS